MASFLDQYGMPGRVVPGLPKGMRLDATEYNDLKNAMLNNPTMLDGIYRHFYEGTGLLSEIMSIANRRVRTSGDAPMKPEAQIQEFFKDRLKFIGNREFAWRVAAPQGWLFYIEEAPTVTQTTYSQGGLNEVSFVVGPPEAPITPDEVLVLADNITQVMVRRVERVINGTRIWVRYMPAPGETNVGIKGYLLERGREMAPLYNLKAESSLHGASPMIRFGEHFRNFTSAMRFEWRSTGDAAHTKIRPEDCMWLTFTDDNGQIKSYWTSMQNYKMMEMAAKSLDNLLFWGRRAITPDGRFLRDSRGYEYISGDGVYYQTNRRLKRGYRNMNSFTMFDKLLEQTYYDNGATKADFLVFGGAKFMTQFSRLIHNELRSDPQIIYFDGFGSFHTGDAGKNKKDYKQGIRINFNYYETELGRFWVSNARYFDQRHVPTLYTASGDREQSYRALMINVNDALSANRGELPVTMVQRAGRQMVMGTINGMSNPGPNGVLTTPEDIEGKHLYMEAGVALHNPNALAEFYYERGR